MKGSLELQRLRVKPGAAGELGLEGCRLRCGSIGRIELRIPWKWHTGKLRAVVQDVHLELQPIAEAWRRWAGAVPKALGDGQEEAELIEELRAGKARAVRRPRLWLLIGNLLLYLFISFNSLSIIFHIL